MNNLWKAEHPNSLDDLDQKWLSELNDDSWHNDTMPKFILFMDDHANFESSIIELWIDYEKEEDREMENPFRFSIKRDMECIFECVTYEEMKTWLSDSLQQTIKDTLVLHANAELIRPTFDYGTQHYIDGLNWWWDQIIKVLVDENRIHDYDENDLLKADDNDQYRIGIALILNEDL
jgi:hypothetical protein